MDLDKEQHYLTVTLQYKVRETNEKRNRLKKMIDSEWKKKEELKVKIESERQHYWEMFQLKLQKIKDEKERLESEWQKEGE